MPADLMKTDLRLEIAQSDADFEVTAGDIATVSGIENLVQALRLRLLIDKGELAALGHPRYGSRVRELIGEPLDSANKELLRRYVRQTLLKDLRVSEVLSVEIDGDANGKTADVIFRVIAIDGSEVQVRTGLNYDN
ncbi:hypothetical protein ACFL2V_00050 [Pseudomonadota bacterium]